MFGFQNTSGRRSGRREAGSQIVEMAAGLTILTMFVFLPIMNLTTLSWRVMSAQYAATSFVRQLALCESFSQALRMVEHSSLTNRLQVLLGSSIKSVHLRLRASRVTPGADQNSSKFLLVDGAGGIPRDWLPDGSQAPCDYALELVVNLMVSPAVKINLPGNLLVPGLTAPVPIAITASHEWENLGRNPETNEYFVNE